MINGASKANEIVQNIVRVSRKALGIKHYDTAEAMEAQTGRLDERRVVIGKQVTSWNPVHAAMFRAPKFA